MRFTSIVVIALLWLAESMAQVSLISDSLYSPSVAKIKNVFVLLPSGYSATQRYPVLYLLHGFGGNHMNWSQRTKIAEYIKDMPLIVVMPDGENSWYVNAASDPQNRFEDFMTEDLPAFIEKQYSVDTTRRAIAGLSMGGYGSVVLALKHPRMYKFAGSLSGALTFPRFLGDTLFQPLSGNIRQNLESVFGAPGSRARAQNDIFVLYKKAALDSLSYFYLVVGTQDGFKGFLPAHRMFTDSLRMAKIRYEYHEAPGGHTWQFWDREIQPLLKRLREVMKF